MSRGRGGRSFAGHDVGNRSRGRKYGPSSSPSDGPASRREVLFIFIMFDL